MSTFVVPFRQFYFDNAWLREPIYLQAVSDCWEHCSGEPIIEKLKYCGEMLAVWGNEYTEPNGFYSVKSSYCYLQELKGVWGLQLESELWRVLWNVKVPPKVLHFAWKAISGCLPTRTQLRTKHVPVDPRCVSGAGLHFSAETTFADWFKAFLTGGRVALVDELLMVAWGIWKARNELLWLGRSSQAADVVRVARSCHSSWLSAQENRSSNQVH
ncbi:hypothetical protein F8388_020350 [Cannabis sativa]|uniref:Reverse transcriptase zinc-binding domain-containing protein n=1 Tax=Cannabis sativa TaxID=3483 RepID=A0A7J6HHJ0_CANSA|nr:hypothetical protein F8388_020350 [Cannabis sativa]